MQQQLLLSEQLVDEPEGKHQYQKGATLNHHREGLVLEESLLGYLLHQYLSLLYLKVHSHQRYLWQPQIQGPRCKICDHPKKLLKSREEKKKKIMKYVKELN